MTTLIHEALRTATKKHRCWICGQHIERSTDYLEQTVRGDDGKPERVRAHLGCDALYWEIVEEGCEAHLVGDDPIQEALCDVRDRSAHITAVVNRVISRQELSLPLLYYPVELRADMPRLLKRYAQPNAPRRDALTLDLFEKEPTP